MSYLLQVYGQVPIVKGGNPVHYIDFYLMVHAETAEQAIKKAREHINITYPGTESSLAIENMTIL